MKQFLSVGLLALVILFQPELRRMLDHLGSVKLTSIFGVSKPVQQEMDAVITQTVRACEAMGREKVGALIAFAREQRLEEYFKTGTQIDGQVSDQLIRNIFFKNSPLHDGAMIIRDGPDRRRRVCAAPVRQQPSQRGLRYPAPCRRGYERGFRRGGGDRLRGNRHHFRGGGRNAQAASCTPDTGQAAAQ